MIKLADLKPGDILRIVDAGSETEGVVVDVSRDDGMVCLDNGTQEFWYEPAQIAAIPVTEKELFRLGFEKVETEDGTKYMKGPFRVLVHDPGNYTNLEVWYREDRRHFNHPIYVHELQNHYQQMTKVPLERPVVH